MNTLPTVLTKSKTSSCPQCKAEDIEVLVYSDTVDFRNMELDVENLQKSLCRNCGHKWTTSEQRTHNNAVMREAYGIVRDELRKKDGLLTAEEITQIREHFKLNQREAAALFGGGYNAFNKYESGEVLQSFPMDRLLRLTSAVGMPAVEFLKDVFSPPQFVVYSTSVRVVISVGDIGAINRHLITGTSGTMRLDAPAQFEKFVNAISDQREKLSVNAR